MVGIWLFTEKRLLIFLYIQNFSFKGLLNEKIKHLYSSQVYGFICSGLESADLGWVLMHLPHHMVDPLGTV